MGNAAGRALPYTAGAPVTGFLQGPGVGVWTAVFDGAPSSPAASDAQSAPGQVHHAKVAIFRFDKRARPGDLPLAQNAMRRLKMLRHPYVLRFVDGGETDEALLMVTETATPLRAWLAASRPGPDAPPAATADFDAACVWGVYTLVTALNFLASIDVVHGAVSPDAVWVTRGGDWKLAGFELAFDASAGGGASGFPDRGFIDADASSCGGGGPCPEAAKAPERASKDWAAAAAAHPSAMDAWGLGVTLVEVWDGGPPLRSVSDVKTAAAGLLASKGGAGGGGVPAALRAPLTRLLTAAPKTRPTFAAVLSGAAAYFGHPLVGALLFIDELALKDPADKTRFFKSLPGERWEGRCLRHGVTHGSNSS